MIRRLLGATLALLGFLEAGCAGPGGGEALRGLDASRATPTDRPTPPEPEEKGPTAHYAAELGLGGLATRGPGAGALFGGLSASLGRGGFRPGVELTLVGFRAPQIKQPGSEWFAALCPGIDLAWHFAQGRARTAISLGPAILLDASASLTPPSGVGLFLDIRPLGLSFPLAEHLRLGVDPLGVRLLMPDLSAIPVYDTQFQTSLWMEVSR